MYVVIWEFSVRPAHVAAFEAAYGPAGAWVALFQRAPGYLVTELLGVPGLNPGTSGRYLTLDRWRDRAAYAAFRHSAAADYAALDTGFESLTVAEREIGAFDTITDTPAAGEHPPPTIAWSPS